MRSLFIITGTNKGLGKALIDRVLSEVHGAYILAIARELHEDHKGYHPSRIMFIKADFAKSASTIYKVQKHCELIRGYDSLYFINNAATVSPIQEIGKLKEMDIEKAFKVNCSNAVSIINFMLQQYSTKRLIFVNVTSGAANKPRAGWAMYCSTKAYMHMFFEVLRMQSQNISDHIVYQIDPGVMDTQMQQTIRTSERDAFPDKQAFLDFHNNGILKSPSIVAAEILKYISI